MELLIKKNVYAPYVPALCKCPMRTLLGALCGALLACHMRALLACTLRALCVPYVRPIGVPYMRPMHVLLTCTKRTLLACRWCGRYVSYVRFFVNFASVKDGI